MGARGKMYWLDGRRVTLCQAAETLGIKPGTLQTQMFRHKEMSLQVLADYRRQGFMGSRSHKEGTTHLVNGKWITIRDAADMFGVTRQAIEKTMRRHRNPDGTPFTLNDTVRYYRELRAGMNPPMRRPAKHVYRGRRMSIPEIAEAIKCSTGAIYMQMCRHGITAEEAANRIMAGRERKAEKQIMWIVWGKRHRRNKKSGTVDNGGKM